MPAWTPEQDDELLERYAKWQSWAEIAAALAHTERACQGHLRQMRQGMLAWEWWAIEKRRLDWQEQRRGQRR